MRILPDPNNPAEVRQLLRDLKVNFLAIHPEDKMLQRYKLVLKLMNKVPGDVLTELGERTLQMAIETVAV